MAAEVESPSISAPRPSPWQVEKQSPFAVASEASSAGGAVRLLQDLRHRHLPSDPRRVDRMEGGTGRNGEFW